MLRRGGGAIRSLTPPCVGHQAIDDCVDFGDQQLYRRDPGYVLWWNTQRDKPARLLPPIVDKDNVMDVYNAEVRCVPAGEEVATSASLKERVLHEPLNEMAELSAFTTAHQEEASKRGATLNSTPLHRIDRSQCALSATSSSVVSYGARIVSPNTHNVQYNSSNEDDDTCSLTSSAVASVNFGYNNNREVMYPNTQYVPPFPEVQNEVPYEAQNEVAEHHFDDIWECECGVLTHASLAFCSGCGYNRFPVEEVIQEAPMVPQHITLPPAPQVHRSPPTVSSTGRTPVIIAPPGGRMEGKMPPPRTMQGKGKGGWVVPVHNQRGRGEERRAVVSVQHVTKAVMHQALPSPPVRPQYAEVRGNERHTYVPQQQPQQPQQPQQQQLPQQPQQPQQPPPMNGFAVSPHTAPITLPPSAFYQNGETFDPSVPEDGIEDVLSYY